MHVHRILDSISTHQEELFIHCSAVIISGYSLRASATSVWKPRTLMKGQSSSGHTLLQSSKLNSPKVVQHSLEIMGQPIDDEGGEP